MSKLTRSYLSAMYVSGCKVEEHGDNRITRIQIPEAKVAVMAYADSSGFFLEDECKNILEIR